MSLIAKGASSLRKKDVQEQRNVALGFKKIRFAHKATLGDTAIDLTSLVQPTEMATYGFVNPNASEMARAQINTFRNNLKLVSSTKGLLVDQLSYTVASSTRINFIDFTADDGEIFVGWLDEVATTSLSVVDGQQIVASGILLAGNTDFNIGMPIPINQNSSHQIGAVMVFADRGLQYRKVGNVTGGAGDYIEVPVAGGLGSLIRFTASGSDRFITVMSNGVVAERPDGSMTALIERTQGQIDAMVPTLAALAGVPTVTFQTAPNSVDLKQFGDTVITNNIILNNILDLEIPIKTTPQNFPSVAAGTLITGFVSNPTFGTIGNNVATWYRDGSDAIITWNFHSTSAGTTGSGIYFFNIPPQIGTIDGTKVKFNTQTTTTTFHDFDSGLGMIQQGSTTGYIHIGQSVAYDATRVKFHYLYAGASQGAQIFSHINAAFSSTECTITLTMRVPITGWLPTQTVRQALGL